MVVDGWLPPTFSQHAPPPAGWTIYLNGISRAFAARQKMFHKLAPHLNGEKLEDNGAQDRAGRAYYLNAGGGSNGATDVHNVDVPTQNLEAWSLANADISVAIDVIGKLIILIADFVVRVKGHAVVVGFAINVERRV